MKGLKTLTGAVLVAIALWIIVGEQMSGASADATVNAPVVTVRAATAGRLSLPERVPGARVSEGETVASVEDALVDRIRLDDLTMEREFAALASARTRGGLKATRALLEALRARVEGYRAERREELRARLSHARARLAILERQGIPEHEQRVLVGALGEEEDAPLPGEPVLASLVLDRARERVDLLEIALHAAEREIFLGDGYNDAPASEQQAVDLRAAIAALEAQLAEQEGRESAVQSRLDRERVRVNGLMGGDIASPVDGLLWEVLEADGVTVQRGDPLLRIADCGQVLVTLSVTERVYNDLSIGQSAEFRISGHLFEATVARLAGAGAGRVYGHLAVAPSQEHLERYDVALLVPGLASDPGIGCAIGRTGRAFFERRPLDWLRP